MRNAGLDDAQAGIKIAGRNNNNFRYADDTTLVAESEEELKNFLMKVKEESEKDGLKLRSWHPIPSLHGKQMGKKWKHWETIFFGFKSLQMVTAAMKTLAPWKKNYGKPRQCIKNQDITLPIKVHIVKAMVFPIVMYGCWESDQKEG